MTNSPVTPRRAPAAVALLTAGWVLAALTSVWRCFGIAMEGWADGRSDGGARSAQLHHQAAAAAMELVVVAVGGAAVIATVAFATRMTRTGAAYAALAVMLGALALPVAAGAGRTPTPSPPPPSAPTICQEHSGGDNQCPGN